MFHVVQLSMSGPQMKYGSQLWPLSLATEARNCPLPVLSGAISSVTVAAAGYVQV